MRHLNLPPQVVRLVLLTIGIVVVYLIGRYFLTPPSFGQYGYYRGNALEEAASHEPVYAGKVACEECHADQLEILSQFEHKTLSCEGCHGVSKDHVENPDIEVSKKVQIGCMRCHASDPSRPAWMAQIVMADHYAGDRCVECHLPHQPNEFPEEEETTEEAVEEKQEVKP